MQATTVREALRASLAGTFGTVLSVLPRLIVFAIALAVGWAVSSLLARATIAALRAVRFDEMARRSGLATFIEHMGVGQNPTGVVASIAKWVVRVMTLVVALDVLGLPAGSGALHQLLLWLPNLAVALVALVIGGVAATALSRLVQGAATVAGLPNPKVLATATSIAVWAFAVVVAVSQLGIATSLVNLALVGVVGGIALAAGLAFGWAGRDRAAQLLSLLDDRYVSRSGAAESQSPAAATNGTSPTAFDAPASPGAAPVIPVSAPASGIPAPVPVTAPGVSAAALETDPSTRAPSPDTVRSTSVADQADLASTPVLDPFTPVYDATTPLLDVSELEYDGQTSEYEGEASEYEGKVPELEGMALENEGEASTFEEPSELEGFEPEFGGPSPEFDGAATEVEASAPMLTNSGPELALFPDAEPALEPARLVPFEENWIPRSGVDRRRIPRPGPDRRASLA
jgi:hypothetical protein